MSTTNHDCQKETEIERLRGEQHRLAQKDEFTTDLLKRLEKTVDEIRGFMARQTENMTVMTRQGEQIITLQRDQKELRRLVDMLFERIRVHELRPGDEAREDGRKLKTGTMQTIINAAVTAIISALTALAIVAQAT